MEKTQKSLKKNFIYNLIYQIFLVVVPLAVTPYVARVLSPIGIGKYSFSYSLITYFTMFGSLGFGYYAQREIAKFQNNSIKQSIVFWEINICRLFPVFIALTTNIIFCLTNLYKEYTGLMYIFSINIFAIIFDIAFFFQGNEDFGKIVLRNVVIKSISIVLIFSLVKNENDVWLYTILNSLMLIISNLSLWPSLFGRLSKVSIRSLKPFKHMKGTIKLFIPTIATTIYTVLDRTLIGLLISDTYVVIENGVEVIKRYADLENGFYEQAEKLAKMTLAIISCIGTVMIPRNSKEFSEGNVETGKSNVIFSMNLVWLIGVPIMLGLIGTSSNFVPWFYGNGYEKCITLINILSPLILIIGFSSVIGLQYLVPTGHDLIFGLILFGGAIINLILNLLLIPILWSFGAAIATVLAEFIITVTMFILIRKDFSIKNIFTNSWKYIISGLIMFVVTFVLSKNLYSSFLNSIVIVFIGILIYFFILLILKDKIVYTLFQKVCKKVLKK